MAKKEEIESGLEMLLELRREFYEHREEGGCKKE